MAFTFPPLPYPSDALEPHIDKTTMEIHHDKHHGTYVNNLNKALESAPELQNKSIEEILKDFFTRVLEFPRDEALIMLWTLAFDLSFSAIEHHLSDRLNLLFQDLDK